MSGIVCVCVVGGVGCVCVCGWVVVVVVGMVINEFVVSAVLLVCTCLFV